MSETSNKHRVKAMKKLLIKIADMLNGNAKRRRAIKEKARFAVMANNQNSATKMMIERTYLTGDKDYQLLHRLRDDYHRNAV